MFIKIYLGNKNVVFKFARVSMNDFRIYDLDMAERHIYDLATVPS